MLLIFPYRWSKSEVIGMPHNLLAFHKTIMLLSTASMVVSNDSLNHLLLGFIVGSLLVLADLCIMFDILTRDIIFLRFLLVQHPILFPTSDIKHHDALDFPRPNLQKLGGMQLGLTNGTPLSFLCSNQENKKCVSSKYLCNPYSRVKTLMLIR